MADVLIDLLMIVLLILAGFATIIGGGGMASNIWRAKRGIFVDAVGAIILMMSLAGGMLLLVLAIVWAGGDPLG